MTITSQIRARRFAPEIEARRALYAHFEGAARERERRGEQLDLLNETWERNLATVPYFGTRAAAGQLPERFESLEEFVAAVPPMTRSICRDERASLTSTEAPPDLVRSTGGSTAEPISFPSWNSELAFPRPDLWGARDWYGITPASSLFHLWGHSHLLGTGVPGWLRARRREIQDRLLGYLRFSAYDIRPEAMRRAVDALIRFRPDYVMGYSVALDRLAQAALERREETRALGIKVVIATAESWPTEQSPELVADVFGCPVAMEYGAVEAGIIAHMHPEGGYRVFWRSFMVECDGPPGAPGQIRITSLYPRSMPLVRYEIGDEIERFDGQSEALGLERFERVVGRCNDFVALSDGFMAHSEVLSHAVRPCEAIRGYQLHQQGRRIELWYCADAELGTEDEQAIRERLGKVHAELAEISFERVAQLDQTIAGKTRMIVRHPEGGSSL